jgi:hypothetical protein
LADAHADRAHEEEIPASELFDKIQPGEGGGDIDRVGDDLDDEGALETGV